MTGLPSSAPPADRRPSGRLSVSRSQMAFAPENRFNRPTVAEIDLDALLHNLAEVRRLAPRARILAVVKANAYGHGAVPVTRALEAAGVDCFGVSLVEEGVELREAGIQGEILVLGGAYSDYDEIVTHRLTPFVFTQEHIFKLQSAASRARMPVTAHAKLDSGMGRLGFRLDELPAFLSELDSAPDVRIDGLASHFANADSGDREKSLRQIEQFRAAAKAFIDAGHPVSWRHLANSAAVLDLDEAKEGLEFNLVRPGLILFGAYPAKWLQKYCSLEPVLAWKTSITHLKSVPAGTPISYGGTWRSTRPSLIAVLPVGYADGYSRRLSNRGEVLVRGQRARIVGNVCMDMFMVDVTDVPGVSAHDEAVLIGRQGSEMIAVSELAERCETIPYEVLTCVGARVPRVLVQRHE